MSAINPLTLALVAMFLQQSFTSLAKIVVPIIAAVALPEMDVSTSAIGIFAGYYSFCQVFIVMCCSNLIRRYGGIRMSQVGLLAILAGMALAALGSLWPFALTAILVSFGVSIGTPASSQILSRYAPPRHAPLIFSAKQSAVPFGIMIAGVLVPFLVTLVGWQGAFLGIGLMCGAFAFMLQPVRAQLDQDRDPTHRLSPRGIKESVVAVLRSAALRNQALAIAAFVGLSTVYTTYFVIFFTERMGYTLTEAGGLLASATLIGLPARIVWGYVASRWLKPSTVLAGLGFIMTVAAVLTGFNTPGWPTWALLAVAAAVISTASGWQGVLLSEVARLAPAGQVGAITGSVIGLGTIGQVILPLIFAIILATTDSYAIGFTVTAVPASVVGLMLLAAGRRESAKAV